MVGGDGGWCWQAWQPGAALVVDVSMAAFSQMFHMWP